MKKTGKHLLVVLFCIAIAFITTEYYQITQYGEFALGGETLLCIALFSAILFLILETARFICKKAVLPLFSKKQYLKLFLVLFAISLVVSAAALAVYLILKSDAEPIGFIHIAAVLACAVFLTGLFILEVYLARAFAGRKGENTNNRDEQGETADRSIGTREITAAVLCILLTAFSFIPVLSDCIHESAPYNSTPKEVVNVGWETDGYGIVGEITADNVITQSFLCTTDTIHTITLSGATYGRENEGLFLIHLVDEETNEILEVWELEMHDFKDNSPFTIEAADPTSHMGMNGRRYKLVFDEESASSGNALTLYYNTNDRYKEGSLCRNGEDLGGDLIMKITGPTIPENYEYVRIWICVYNTIMAHVLVCLLCRKTADRKAKEEGISHGEG